VEECVAYRDLREFVRKLEKEGELQRVRAEVDPILEITEITQRIARAPGRRDRKFRSS
jgi:4-hydroxy-3-polyprenylbenzoate decarboxylase